MDMTDESYEAGYRAGHLQGWLDAMARVAAEPPAPASSTARPTPVAPRAEPLGPPAVPTPPLAPVQEVFGAAQKPWAPTRQPLLQPALLQPARQQLAEPAHATPAQPLAVPPSVPMHGTAVPVETEAERQARRARRDRQNINITLYVASLLLVAAAALFIGTGLPPMLRFAGVCAVAAAFYVAGFVLHAKVARLKPAAVAFTGTGLALVPVTGLAMYNFVWSDGPAAWLVTSLVGTAAYVAASVRLESRVLAYLSLTFLISTAWSGTAVLGAALVWYFVVLIAVSIGFTVLSLGRPGWLPPLYVQPLAVLHPVLVPAVALVVTCIPGLISASEYAGVIGLCGVYFVGIAAVRSSTQRVLHYFAARAALTAGLSVGVAELTGHGRDGLLAAVVLLAAQSIAVAYGMPVLAKWFPSAPVTDEERQVQPQIQAQPQVPPRVRGRWRFDALGTFAVQVLATGIFAVAVEFSRQGQGGVPLWVPVLILLATSMVIAARLGGRAEYAPYAALLLAGLAAPVMGAWPLALMLLLAGAGWLARMRPGIATPATVPLLLFNARLALTAAAPAVAAAVTDGSAQRPAILAALLVAVVLQQLLSVWVMVRSRPALAPEATLMGFVLAGVACSVVLAWTEPAPLATAGLFLQLAAAVAVGLFLLPRNPSAGRWSASVGEVLPPAAAAVLVLTAFSELPDAVANAALLLLTAYFLVAARRLPGRGHRWTYWWLARAAGTVLVLTGLAQYAPGAVQPAVVLVLVLAAQLVFPLGAAILGRAPRGVLADTEAVVFLQLAASAMLAPALSTGTWHNTAVLAATALSAAAAGYVLRERRAAVVIAPAAVVALAVLSAGNPAYAEILLAVFGVFAAAMVVAAPQPVRKGWYFVAARVSAAALAVVFSYDAGASPTAVSLTFAGVLAAQHGVRWAMRHRLAAVPFQQAAVWITLAGQAILPVVFSLRNVSGPGAADAGRWVVLLELALLLVSAVVASRLFAARGALYFGVFALLALALSLGPVVRLTPPPFLTYTGTLLVLMGLAVAACAAGVWRRGRPQESAADRWLWVAAAGAFAVTALSLSPLAMDWAPGAAVLVVAATCFTVSHVERIPVLYPVAAAAVLAGAGLLSLAVFPPPVGVWGSYWPWLAGTGLAAVGLYGARWLPGVLSALDPVRRWSLVGGALVGLAGVAAQGLRADATSWTGAAVLAAGVGITVVEVPARWRRATAELGAVAVLAGIQRASIFSLDTRSFAGLPDLFWVVQWYVLLGAAVAVLRYLAGQAAVGRTVLSVAAGLLTLSGLGIVFGGNGGQQLWVLVLLAGLLLAGLAFGERLFVWWGAAGVAACVLWAMRQYTFALLALIAVGLIAFAVWRLNRSTGTGPEAGDGASGNAP